MIQTVDDVGDLRLATVVVNVQDMGRAVDFWSAALGYRPRESAWDPEFMMLVHPRHRWPPVSLQLSQAAATAPAPVHLDLYTSEQARHVQRLVELGATRVEDWPYPPDADFVVLRDPDGNEFCVIDHDDSEGGRATDSHVDDVSQVRALIERWAAAVHEGDLESVLADHADDIVMFDVPPPDQGIRGIAAYRETWGPFFKWQRRASFDLESLDVTAGADVGFAYALLRCGTPEELAEAPERRLRLTVGLRKVADRWVVTHEHHSFVHTD